MRWMFKEIVMTVILMLYKAYEMVGQAAHERLGIMIRHAMIGDWGMKALRRLGKKQPSGKGNI